MMAILNELSFIGLILLITFNGSSQEEEIDEVIENSAKKHGFDTKNLKPGEVYLVPPVLTDEEEGSHQMPRDYRCSGCVAAAYQFQKAFTNAERKVKKGSRLPYSDILDIADIVCEKKMVRYGIKTVKGNKYLSGEGLKYDKYTGIMEAGGMWEVRLITLCNELIERYEEDGIYDQFVRRGGDNLYVTLCSGYCTTEELRDKKDEL